MKKGYIIFLVIVIIIFNCHEFNNPVDPDSPEYIGNDSIDYDGDGIGSYNDIDDITPISPIGGGSCSDLPIFFLVNKFNEKIVKKYWIQISESKEEFDSAIIYSFDGFESNPCEVTASVFTNSTSYYWHAKASDGKRWSNSWSSIESLKINSVDYYVTDLYPADNQYINDTTPSLHWEENLEATKYHIQLNSRNDFTGSILINDNSLDLPVYHVNNPLSHNNIYFWRVRIQNSDDIWCAWNDVLDFGIDETLKIPILNIPAYAEVTADTTPLLDWTDLSEVIHYHLQMSTVNVFTAEFSELIIIDEILTSSEFQLTSLLDNNTVYYWRVRVYDNDEVYHPFSDMWHFKTFIPVPYDGNCILYESHVLLDWKNEGSFSRYHLVISKDPNLMNDIFSSDEFVSNSEYNIPIESLEIRTTYYWHVRIQNSDGIWGDWSDVFILFIPLNY